MPEIGALITVSPSKRSAAASRDFASATTASDDATVFRARSSSRAASAPASTSRSVRSVSRRATANWFSADRSEETADWRASSSVRVSIRASRAPRATGCASSTATSRIAPPISARTVASRAALSSPEMIGPTTTVPEVTVTTFSAPIWTATGAAGAVSPFAPPPQAVASNARCKCKMQTRPTA